jgi:hypothetical protein
MPIRGREKLFIPVWIGQSRPWPRASLPMSKARSCRGAIREWTQRKGRLYARRASIAPVANRQFWAPVSFIAVLAVGATLLGIHAATNWSDTSALPVEPAHSQVGGETESEAMIVVNPDGSVRASPEPSLGDEAASEAEDPDLVPDIDEDIDDGFAREQDEEPADGPGAGQSLPGGRIE